jgi:curved DNA-binding protein
MGAREALALLGLAGPASSSAVTAAFRAAVKAARPDMPGGCPDRFRRVIEAYRLIQTLDRPAAALPSPKTPPKPVATAVFEISIDEALGGIARPVRLPGGRVLGIRLPAGLRTEDRVRLRGCAPDGEDLYLRIALKPEPNRRLDGDHLHVVVAIQRRVLEDGGRVQVGGRSILVPRGFCGDALRVKGQGLPARDARPCGDLFVRLELLPEAPPQTAEQRLRAFIDSWADPGFVTSSGIG